MNLRPPVFIGIWLLFYSTLIGQDRFIQVEVSDTIQVVTTAIYYTINLFNSDAYGGFDEPSKRTMLNKTELEVVLKKFPRIESLKPVQNFALPPKGSY